MRHSAARRPRVAIVITLLSLLPLLAYFADCTWINPVSAYLADYDPEFNYLMNSLGVFNGRAYAYVDHPGTPVEMIGTAIYALTYPVLGRSPEEFSLYHLQNAGLFLTLAHGFLLAASAACLWYVAGIRRRDEVLLPSALAALYFVIHPLGFRSLTVWSHNSFAFAFGTLYLALLYGVLRRQEGSLSRLQTAMFGAGAGLLASVTIYLAAWVVGAAVIVMVATRLRGASRLKMLGSGLTLAVGSLLGFGLGVLPVLGRMPYFFNWIDSLLTHRDAYLLGPTNLPPLERLLVNLLGMYRQGPQLFIVMAGLIIAAVLAFALRGRGLQKAPEVWAFIFGTSLMILLLTGFIADHPSIEYLLSAAAVAPMLAVALIEVGEAEGALGTRVERLLGALILVGLVMAFIQAVRVQQAKVEAIDQVNAQTERSIAAYAGSTGRQPSDLMVLWLYRSYSPCFSLWFGNDTTARAFGRELRQICYRQFELNIFGENVISGPGARPLSDYRWDMIIGCSGGFQIPLLVDLPNVETFPDLRLDCGPLTIAYNRK